MYFIPTHWVFNPQHYQSQQQPPAQGCGAAGRSWLGGGRISYLCALLHVPVELHQALPGGFGGRGQGEGLFHVGGPVPQPALDAVSFIELLYLWDMAEKALEL